MTTIPGKEIALGGQKYILPPLNAAAVKQYREQISSVFVGQLPDIELVSTLAHAALKRNYPEITVEQVDNLVDYGNMLDVWENLMNLSGLAISAGKMVRRVQQELEAAGMTSTT